MASLTQAKLLDVTGRYTIANIGLNGYKSQTRGLHDFDNQTRTIWSFTVFDGDKVDLQTAWWERTAVMMRINEKDVPVRVAALPVDDDSFGLIEYI